MRQNKPITGEREVMPDVEVRALHPCVRNLMKQMMPMRGKPLSNVVQRHENMVSALSSTLVSHFCDDHAVDADTQLRHRSVSELVW